MADTKAAKEDTKAVVNNEAVTTEPVIVTFADVSAAPYRIREGVSQTPCEASCLFYKAKLEKLLGLQTMLRESDRQ